jgi:hypothetical protein
LEPTSPAAPQGAPHSGLGIASNLFGASAAILLAVSLVMLIKAATSGATGAAVTAQGLISLASMAGMGVAAVVLLAGVGLGIGGLMQPDRNPLLAITGTVINSSLLMTLTLLSIAGVMAAKAGMAAKSAAAAAAAAPAPPPANPGKDVDPK